MIQPSAPGAFTVLAAGSLKSALTEFASTLPRPPHLAFGPAGLLRREIERGRACDIYLSANTEHPAALGTEVRPFARNPIRVLARRALALRAETLLDQLLHPALRLGTSTPGADPSGDYAQALFDRAETMRPGAGRALRAKALHVVGGAIPAADSPDKESGIAAMFADGTIDAFICYRSSAQRLSMDPQQDRGPSLDVVVPLPPLDVVATYALVTLVPGPAATGFVSGLLAAPGQAILARHGFDPADATRRGG